jgi:hypothetical protein
MTGCAESYMSVQVMIWSWDDTSQLVPRNSTVEDKSRHHYSITGSLKGEGKFRLLSPSLAKANAMACGIGRAISDWAMPL